MRRGFTLIELMFVVVIIGVLTTLAIYSYTRQVVATRAVEPTTFLLDLRAKQFTHHAVYGTFVGSPEAASWPAEVPVGVPTNWGLPDNLWTFARPDRSTWFQYTMVAGRAGQQPPANSPIQDASKAWFWAYARGDADGDGKFSYFEISSERTRVYSENVTE